MNGLFKGICGIARDEAVLAIAMVAGTGAVGGVALQWDGASGSFGFGASGPEKVMEQLNDIQRANTAFYDTFGKWPHEVTNGRPSHNAAVLASKSAMIFPYSTMSGHRRLVSENNFTLKNNSLRHTLGEGGMVMQDVQRGDKGRMYLAVKMENVPLYEAQAVDTKIDGVYGPEEGRVLLDMPTDTLDNDRVTLYYLANRV